MFFRKKQKYQRRSFRSLFIEPFKQVKFGLSFLGLSSLFLIIMAYMIIQGFLSQYDQLMQLYNVTDQGAKYALITNDIFIHNMVYLSVIYLIYILVLFFFVFKITHRFYGPTVAIDRFIKQMKEGNYSFRLSIRKKDELQNVIQNLNSLAEVLEKRHSSTPKDQS